MNSVYPTFSVVCFVSLVSQGMHVV